ncbi:MAG TPA: HesA/MoeB/ThiF family protein, partial [Desulfobacteraceae bacterium]|nr:HesA/MoeB/ThiF family protein [Desulfobacteraceae bacterium]
MNFTTEQLNRYSRHILLQDVGVEGQVKLCRARVLVVGAGGLGSPAALYLAAAGVGTIGIVDNDQVDISNLQRQIVHGTKDIGRSKVESAAEAMRAINPDVEVRPLATMLCADN